jgi:hypothetical protein
MSHGCVSIPKEDGLMNQHGHPGLLRLYGQYFFEWSKEKSEELVFKDAIIYEARIFRQFIITGFQRNRGRQLSISTIGTAPSSSPIQDDRADSERTIVAVTRPVFRLPRPVSPETGIQISPQTSELVPRASGSTDFARNWTFPYGSPGMSGQTIANSSVPESPTPRPAAERIQPYRPPHARNAAGLSDARLQRGRGSRQSRQFAGSSMSRMPPPTYYAPHATAHNIRSSSDPDPFDANRPMAPASQRSISDFHRPISNIDGSIFDGIRAARGPGAAKK